MKKSVKKDRSIPYAVKLAMERQHRADMTRQCFQYADDALMIVCNEVFGMGAGRARKVHEAFTKTVNEIAELVCTDSKDDKEFIYAKAKIDERLRQIVGDENFQPWEVRYRLE